MMKISKIDNIMPKVFIPDKDTVSRLFFVHLEIELVKKGAGAPP